MGHSVLIRNAWPPFIRDRIHDVLRECDVIIFADVLLSKEPKVQDDTRIGSGSDITIGKGVAVNLNVILVLVIIPNHELRFGVIEWDRERIAGMFGLVNFDRFLVVGVGLDSIDYGPLEDDLLIHQTNPQGNKTLLKPDRKSSTVR